MRIIGVDFSGAEREVGKTWVARGELVGNVLTIENCQPISRADLTNELAGLREPAVVGMDFPFSVPEVFAKHWKGAIASRCGSVVFDSMPNLWAAAAGMKWENLKNLQGQLQIDKFAKRDKRPRELKYPKRASDPSEALSPLNIRMVQMTFRGMQMLNRLKERPEIRVPPLHPDPEQDFITLLEIMPGATLRSFGLPYTGYKNTPGITPEQREQRREMRRYILNELPGGARPVAVDLRVPVGRCHQRCQAAPRGANLLPLYAICHHHDDALDAVVAAIAAALWAIPETREHFIRPPEPIAPTVRLEGWLYTPGGCYLHNCAGPI